MPDVSISSDDHKLVSNERVAMKLALVPILSDVIFPFHLSARFVESTDFAIARADDKEITHDRGRREYSTPAVKFPAYFRYVACLPPRCGERIRRRFERREKE